MKHPIQPIVKDSKGTERFKENTIVSHLLDWASERGMGMNELARMDFSQDDRTQFAQLIGYSLNGFSELGYVSDETFNAAVKMRDSGMTEDRSRIECLQTVINQLKLALREPMAMLFSVHPDDLSNHIEETPVPQSSVDPTVRFNNK